MFGGKTIRRENIPALRAKPNLHEQVLKGDKLQLTKKNQYLAT